MPALLIELGNIFNLIIMISITLFNILRSIRFSLYYLIIFNIWNFFVLLFHLLIIIIDKLIDQNVRIQNLKMIVNKFIMLILQLIILHLVLHVLLLLQLKFLISILLLNLLNHIILYLNLIFYLINIHQLWLLHIILLLQIFD
jgi:hypothetical protein